MFELKLKNKPYILKSKKYSTIDFILVFPYNFDKNNIFPMHILKNIMSSSSKKYPEETKFNEYLKNHMLIYKIESYLCNECQFLEFTLRIPDPKKVKGVNLEKEIKFFLDTIYKPNIKNKLFSKKDISREKEYLKNLIERHKKNIYNYSKYDFDNYFDQENIINNSILNFEKKLPKVKNSDIYNLYNNIITNNQALIFAYGNISKNEVSKLFSDLLNNKKEIIINNNYRHYLNLKNETLNIEKKSDFNQSVLTLGFKVRNMCKKDENYLYLLNSILMSKENRLLFKALRTDNDLVYDCDSYFYKYFGGLCINAYLNKDSKEQALEIIKNIINRLKTDKKYLKIEVEKYTKGAYYTLLRTLDSKYSIFYHYIDKLLEIDEYPKVKYRQLLHADLNYFIDFLNRLELDTVYFLRGEANEKN